ncbi:AAA family ATPase [Acinetobacter towneri]|uniref:ATP-dependent nuclease n=1 Tax=Acinetobacter towneri TaxID=202956 RepID=UPI002578CC90|nr:AAA family ATPase [Acinetobacter towneri]MDM1736836.1 AAA family ATPase [Acinetobacter towneri]
MKISKIELKKFRSIEKCLIELNDLNAIVGQNNSGKSAIIRALNCFFNFKDEEVNFIQGKHHYNPSSTPVITLTFIDFDSEFGEYAENSILQIQQSFKSSSKKAIYKYKRNGSYVNAPDTLLEMINSKISFVYIPPNRSAVELKWEEDSLIKELIEEYLKKETARRDNLTPKFKQATEHLENGVLNKIGCEVEKFYSLKKNFTYNLSFNSDSNYSAFLNNIEVFIEEFGIRHNLDDCGTGLQSVTIIAFYRVLAKLKGKHIILGLEEPETNLHPQAQRELINSIKNTSPDEYTQVLLTTHSTVIVDNVDHKHITLVRKVKDEQRGFKSEVFKLKQSFFEDHNLEEFKYYQFHHYRNSDFFFANYVIFVESKNDAEVVKYLAKTKKIDLDLYGVSLIDIGGVKNLAYPFHIVKDLNLPNTVILDKDYFIPYLNDELNNSRDAEGLPKYKYEFKRGTLLSALIPSASEQEKLLGLFKTNHSKALDHLEKFNITRITDKKSP